jgi:hypothetical protein
MLVRHHSGGKSRLLISYQIAVFPLSDAQLSRQKADGYVIGSSIKHVPIAGRDITDFVLQLLRDRGETATIPAEDQRRT